MTEPAEASQSLARNDNGETPAAEGSSSARLSLGARLTDLGPRLGSAAILIAVAVVSWWIGRTVFMVVWLVAALIVHFEWQRIVGGARFATRLVIGSVALIAAAILTRGLNATLASILILFAALAVGYAAGKGHRAWAAGGVFYAGSLIVAVLTLRMSFPFGKWAIGWLFALVWGTDASAYFAGRLIGGPKFMPLISPSKTWSGTGLGIIGGALIGSAFLAVVVHFVRLETLEPSVSLFLLGLIIAAVAQAGDLGESWMKRCFGTKDSSNFIPGHGGLMDRLDGFIAAVVFAAIVGALRVFPTTAEGLFHWM